MHATIPVGNMGYDQYTVPDNISVKPAFFAPPLALTNIYPWPLVLFFQFSLKNSELKTTQNLFGIVVYTFLEIAIYILRIS